MARYLILILALFNKGVFAQQITHVSALQAGNTIRINYTLEGAATVEGINVFYKCNSDGWQRIVQLSGDTTHILPGKRELVWYVLNEIPALVCSALQIKIEPQGIKPVTSASIPIPAANTLTDQAGNTYRTVIIGDQLWMAENLNVDRFRNGNLIPEIKNAEEWKKAFEAQQPAWCYYDNRRVQEGQLGSNLGKLYNWYAVADTGGLCPTGWHVPSDDDWTMLTNYLGGAETAGLKMKSSYGWKDNGNGSNNSGFNGLPGGYRSYYYGGSFYPIGSYGYWWSSSEDSTYYAWSRDLSYGDGSVDRNDSNKGNGFSVRCLRD